MSESNESKKIRREHLKWRQKGGSMSGGVGGDLGRWKGKTHKGRNLSRGSGQRYSYMAHLNDLVGQGKITEDQWREMVAEATAPGFAIPPREEWPT